MPESLLVLVWREPTSSPDAFAAELHESARNRLHSAGVALGQMNVADAEVAAAAPLRQVALDPQPAALLRIQLDDEGDADPANALGALADLTAIGRSAAYRVTTREPLADRADQQGPGGRSPGFSQIALLRRRDDLSTEEFRSRWLDHHTAVALDTQSTTRYVQHIVEDALTPDAPSLDGIVEECFPAEAMTDTHIFFDTGGDHQKLTERLNTMVASVSEFLDLANLDVIPMSEYRFDLS